MRFTAIIVLFVVSLIASKATLAATADEVKRINECVTDHKDVTLPMKTGSSALDYCTCMNSKMDNNKTQSIGQWEKAHRADATACAIQAGWK
jgi:hypothetical protein